MDALGRTFLVDMERDESSVAIDLQAGLPVTGQAVAVILGQGHIKRGEPQERDHTGRPSMILVSEGLGHARFL